MSKQETLKQLEEACKHHDWYYERSDDHGVWSRGKSNRQDISRLLDKAKNNGFYAEAEAIFNKYAPK